MSFDKLTVEQKIAIHKELVLKHDLPCCPNCENFTVVDDRITDEEKTYYECSLYKAYPPEEVIAFGCISFEPSIPF